MFRLFLILAALVTLAAPAEADVSVRVAQPGAASPPAKIADFAWLEGTWIGAGLGGQTEETYSAPLGNAIVGTFRFVKDGKPVFYELVTVVEEGGSVLIRLKHFHPNLVGWEEKDKSVEFKLVALEGQTAYFDGQTLRREDDTLLAAVLIKGKDDKEGVEQFSYKLKKVLTSRRSSPCGCR